MRTETGSRENRKTCSKKNRRSRKDIELNSTLIDMAKARNDSVQIKFIYGICAGLGISIKDFFDSPYFDKKTLID